MYRSTVSSSVQLQGSVLQVLTDQGGDGVKVVRLALEEGEGWRTDAGGRAKEIGRSKGRYMELDAKENVSQPWDVLSGRQRSTCRDRRDRSRR